MFSKDDFILNGYGMDILPLHMQKRGNQPLENTIIFLKECSEKVVIYELDIELAGGLFPIGRRLRCCIIDVFSCLIFINRVSPFVCVNYFV